MAHFAKVINGIVDQVIVAEQDFIDSGAVGDPATWVQTSYNTRGGVHYGQDGQPDGGVALRKNYAGIGYTYDAGRDAFIPPKPFNSWVLDEQTCYWNPPVPQPEMVHPTETEPGTIYNWNEDTLSWDPQTIPALGVPA